MAGDSPSDERCVPDDYFRRVNAAVRTLDPAAAADDGTEHVVTKLHDGLAYYPDAEPDPELLLATDWERSDDLRTYAFSLKRGVSFHDGRELTADDVVYSFERVAASPNSEHAGLLLDALGVVHDTDADGEYRPGSLAVAAREEYTVELTLAEPFHATLDVLASPALAIVPENAVDDVPGYDGERSQSAFATEEPVGCGPFAFEDWRPDRDEEVASDSETDDAGGLLAVERFDDYHGDPAAIPGVCWYTGYDADERYRRLLDGEIDLAGVPSARYDPELVAVEETDEFGRETGTYGPVGDGERLGLVRVPILSTYFLAFDAERVPRPVRRAVAHAVNQHEPRMRFKGRHDPAYHLLPPSLFPGENGAAADHARENYPYGYDAVQLDRARETMAEAGYGPDRRYEFTVTAPKHLDWTPLFERLRDRLADAHVDLRLEELPYPEIFAKRGTGAIDAYYGGWVADWPAADHMLRPLTPAAGDSPYRDHLNWAGTEAAERAGRAWDRMLANRAPTPEAEAVRDEAALDVEAANWEDVAVLPLCHAIKQFVWNDRVDPTLPGPMSYRLLKHTDVRLSE